MRSTRAIVGMKTPECWVSFSQRAGRAGVVEYVISRSVNRAIADKAMACAASRGFTLIV